MLEALVTTGNQITIPRVVREALGMKPGDIIGFVPSQRGFALRIVGRKVAKGRTAKPPATPASR